ncbi:MAG: HAD hydrolase-like protein, partial [Methylocystis sp.]
MSKLPPILVFDLDGTLADTAPDLIGTLNVLLAREGLPARSPRDART